MMSNPRGYALIINNIKFIGDPEATRGGAEKDSTELQNLLLALGFEVILHHDVTVNDLMNSETGIFKTFKEKFERIPVDCCVVAIMSHGLEGMVRMSDPLPKDLSNYLNVYYDIVYNFNNMHCPVLCGKPKLFLFQACRGDIRDRGFRKTRVDGKIQQTVVQIAETSVDASPFIPDDEACPSNEDMLVCFSTVPGYVSNRDTEHGTWYIQLFCRTVAELAHNTEVSDILKEVRLCYFPLELEIVNWKY
jgi:hypothetical protein